MVGSAKKDRFKKSQAGGACGNDVFISHPQGPQKKIPKGRFTNSLCFGNSFELWGLGKFGGIFPGYVGKIIEFWFFGRACLTTNSKHKLYSYMLKSPITLVEYWHVLAPIPALSKIAVNAHTCFCVFLMSRWCYIHMYIQEQIVKCKYTVSIFFQRDTVCMADGIDMYLNIDIFTYVHIMIVTVGKSLIKHSLQKVILQRLRSIKYWSTHISHICVPTQRLIPSTKYQVSSSAQGRYRLAIDERCSASVHEVTPRCEHFAQKCGGCAFQNLHLEQDDFDSENQGCGYGYAIYANRSRGANWCV